ncbi:DNA alkylation repair protein [Candidatus Pacearchaeota archaeon]|nr:DNA alkylation repair protein [Candidatus Pacearchaeota archaeon]
MNKEFEKKLKEVADLEKAKLLQRFFKTEKGEYDEGDVFLGIVVPELRKIAKEFCDLNLNEIQELLDSKIHEKRMIGLFILIKKYDKADELLKKQIFEFYIKSAKNNKINNWDLVDLSAPNIVGNYLIDKNRNVLYKLVISSSLWEKRIAVLATFSFIREGDFSDSLKISKILLGDKHDLIHKAVGWMLREIGKRDVKVLEGFLKENYKIMPRTMLRYAIEKFPEEKRKSYLSGKV